MATRVYPFAAPPLFKTPQWLSRSRKEVIGFQNHAPSRHLHIPASLPPQSSQHSRPRIHQTVNARFASSRVTQNQNARPALNPDRGPASEENTQTDFDDLNVLGATPMPTSSVDICTEDGFVLDSGLKITDGDGVMLVEGEAFVWRPWLATPASSVGSQILKDVNITKAGNGTGGLINAKGLMEIPRHSLGVLGLVWPKPDLIIIGTGERIHPLETKTRETLQQLGVRIEVLDTRNAASQFNMLATERGVQEVAAAMLPVGFKVKSPGR